MLTKFNYSYKIQKQPLQTILTLTLCLIGLIAILAHGIMTNWGITPYQSLDENDIIFSETDTLEIFFDGQWWVVKLKEGEPVLPKNQTNKQQNETVKVPSFLDGRGHFTTNPNEKFNKTTYSLEEWNKLWERYNPQG